MFILVTGDHHWWLGFINPRWSFAPNEKMPVELRFDGGPRLAMTATVPSRLIVLVPLPSDPRLIDRLGRSAELVLVAEGRSFFFQLSGTPAVTAELKTCVQKSLALQATAPTAPTTATAAALSTATTPAAGANAQASAAGDHTAAGCAPAGPIAGQHRASGFKKYRHHPLPRPQSRVHRLQRRSICRNHRSPRSRRRFRLAPPTTEAVPPAAGPDLEEVRLAQDFFTTAQLPNARLIVDRQAGGACQLHRRMALRQCCRRGQNHCAGSRCQRHRYRIRSDCCRPADVPRKFRLGASEH